MNILFFHQNCINPTGGGISRITSVLGKAFEEKGNNVFFLCCEEKNDEALPNQYVLPNTKNVYNDANRNFLKEFCSAHEIDVIINQSALLLSFGKLMSELTGVKRISVLHSSLFVPYRHSAYLIEYDLKKKGLGFILPLLKNNIVNNLAVHTMVRKRKQAYKQMVNYSDAVVALTEGQVEDFRLVLDESGMKKLHVIHNGIELLPESPISVSQKKQVLWVGTIDFTVKRTDLMLEIWKRASSSHPDWSLKILGDSPEADEAKEYARKRKIKNIEFVGRVDPEPFYLDSQIVCVTSTHECFCMVLLEALKYGLATIAFDSFPAAKEEIIDGTTGKLIPAFSVKKYADALSSIMTEDENRSFMQKQAIEFAGEFKISKIADQWLSMLNNMN